MSAADTHPSLPAPDWEAIAASLNQALAPLAWQAACDPDAVLPVICLYGQPIAAEPTRTEPLAIALTHLAASELGDRQRLRLQWQQAPEQAILWQCELTGAELSALATAGDRQVSLNARFAQLGERVSQAAAQASTTLARAGETANQTAAQTSRDLTQTAGTVAKAVSQAAKQSALTTGSALSGAAAYTSKTVSEVAQTTVSTLGNASHQAVVQATVAGGQASKALGEAAQWTANLPLLGTIVERVDVVKARTELQRLQAKHPDEPPAKLAQRLMAEKALLAGSSGLATSFLPGAAVAFLAIDLAAVAGLQAEMVLQIAGAYGLDLDAPERRTEVLAIFGIALGSGQAVKAGLSILRTAPAIGAILGVSSNVASIYAVGYAACQFYEAQLRQASDRETIQASVAASDRYLAAAIAQEAAADCILLHVLRAGAPDRSWSEWEPELRAANLPPGSLAAMAAHFDNLPPLDDLLAQVSDEFVGPLLQKCHQIAALDGQTNAATAAAIAAIAARLERVDSEAS